MDKNAYNITNTFECNGNKMLVVRMSEAACVMPEEDYNRIITAERKYRRWKRKKVA